MMPIDEVETEDHPPGWNRRRWVIREVEMAASLDEGDVGEGASMADVKFPPAIDPFPD